jgi:dihydropteroate synthase
LSEEFYLQPFNHSFDEKGSIKFQNANILKTKRNNTFEIKHTVNISKTFTNSKSNTCLKKYLNLSTRLKRINNPVSPIDFICTQKPLIMGVLNITEDSFHDGGRYFDLKSALNRAETLVKEGADIIDVGGESTRPGASVIDSEEEIKRIKPVIKELLKNNILISCDTRNSLTMQVVLDLGTKIINDVSSLNYDKNTLKLLKDYNCTYVLMHSKGTPQIMQNNPIYNNVVCDIYNFFKKKLNVLKRMNISKERIILDPGIGFAKTLEHNYTILKNLGIFLDLGHHLMIGVSRKSLIKRLTKTDTLTPSVVLAVDAYAKGAKILRVHDVKETKEAINIFKRAN